MDSIFERLAEPFPAKAIHWRVGSRTKDKTKGTALAYLDARDVMDRLDEVLGPENWEDYYQETSSGRVVCSLTIRVGDRVVTKSDAAGDTQVEGEKGAVSDAFKRAAVKFGLGRYLYRLPTEWVALKNERYLSETPTLPDWALPGYGQGRVYAKVLEAHWDTIAAIKNLSGGGNLSEIAEAWHELTDDEKTALWVAPSKFGVFTTKEREIIRDASVEFPKITEGS